MKRLAICGILGVLLSCAGEQEPEETSFESSSIKSDTIAVASYVSRFERLTYPVKTVGKIRSRKRRNLIFERSGILQSLSIQNGSRVREGQIIATLKNKDEMYTRKSAEITLKNALVEYESEMLALGDSAYYKDRWLTVKENVALKTGVLAARVNLQKAELAYEQTIIRAPISGIIEGIDIQPGDFVSTNFSLGSIYDPGSFEVICDVLEYDVMKVKEGMKAAVFPLASEGSNTQGVVSEINPAVNENGLSRVVINLKKSNGIIPGLSARVEINVTDEPSIVIPLKAVVKRSERHVVFNIDKGLAKWNYVTLGKNNGEKVQILEGLNEDMQIIVSNNLQLAHDSPVRLQ